MSGSTTSTGGGGLLPDSCSCGLVVLCCFLEAEADCDSRRAGEFAVLFVALLPVELLQTIIYSKLELHKP